MRCAVLGSPIAHSLSPAMHRAAYAELGLDWTYDAVAVEEHELPLFLRSLGDDVRGLSVTAPLKRAAAQEAHQRSEHVELLGVANTLVVDDGMLSAHNTDVTGALAAMQERGLLSGIRTARILGAGATATSMAYALSTHGLSRLELVVRDPARARETQQVAERRGVEVVVRGIDEPLTETVDLLISTVPEDVAGARSRELTAAARAVFDIVYDPWPTTLLAAAAESGLPTVSGLDLLAHQAALQVELMTGSTVDPQILLNAAMGELATR
ncbi:shikimate dehydrogenase [Aeromicrobium sp. A1-2]|uniref:shikimate dehydrogenase n=1 Tax=Aeromicrobium sp. A1-2 TaxID=2107713 RepID=UPI0020B110A2|nr:shikimate dehydrogenase [Aeromicrobium sp. A1-2]